MLPENNDITAWISSNKNDELETFLENHPGAADQKTPAGVSLLLLAKYHRNDAAVTLLKKYKSSLDVFEAVCTGELEILQAMLKTSPGIINQPSPDGFSLLGYASFFGYPEIARYLVQNGAEVNKPSGNSFKVTPLHSACANFDIELVTFLLANNADVNARQQAGFTPLHAAAHHGKTNLAKLLLDNGADAHAKTDGGENAAALAEKSGFPETAAFIRSYR